MGTVARLVVLVAIVSAAVALYHHGTWNPASTSYWREYAQTALLKAAQEGPARFTADLTRTAVSLRPEGLTYAEVEQAATLFEQSNQKEQASALWLMAAKMDVTTRNGDRAWTHALRAREAHGSEHAYLTVLQLSRSHADRKMRAVADFRQHLPQHPITRAYECLDALRSLETSPSAACTTLSWMAQSAQSAHGKYQELTAQLGQLPSEKSRHIADAEHAIAMVSPQQKRLADRYHRLNAELENLEENGAWAAGVEGVLRAALPIPQPGDTLEVWLAREGICALPIIRWVCRASDFAQPFAELQRKREALTGERNRVAQQWNANETTLRESRNSITYWRSEEPEQKLRRARNELLPSLRRHIEESALDRFPEIGLSPEAALATVLPATSRS